MKFVHKAILLNCDTYIGNFPVSKSYTNCLDFAINRFLMKLFKTNNINIIEECRVYFGVILPSSLITSRTDKFMFKLQFLENSFCNIFN